MIACIYTWVNVNLNFTKWNDLMFPKNHIFLFTEDDLTGFLSKTEAISYLKLCSANQKENSHICRLFANPWVSLINLEKLLFQELWCHTVYFINVHWFIALFPTNIICFNAFFPNECVKSNSFWTIYVCCHQKMPCRRSCHAGCYFTF